MDINNMTRKEFLELPKLDMCKPITINGIVLIPTGRVHDSGYNYYIIVFCNKTQPLGKVEEYDIFRFYNMDSIGIDCLRKSHLMRMFFKDIEVRPYMYSIGE